MRRVIMLFVLVLLAGCSGADPLPSWRNTETKAAIRNFVEAARQTGQPGYIPQDERIAVFDNDGTLWGEQPLYFQALFAIDEAKRLAGSDSRYAALLEAMETAGDGHAQQEALLAIVAATHTGMSVENFQARVRSWLDTARHPVTGRRYDEMTYRPMVELLRYLRASGFKTYIVSGGGVDFMRAFAEEAYGIPPEQVLGSLTKSRFELTADDARIIKDEGIAFIDDKDGKPVNIQRQIGRRPVLVGGNSDGDLAMAEYAAAGDGPRLVLFVHHTDAEREVAYDRDSSIGRFDGALTRAGEAGWVVVDMAEDWERIYAP